MHFMLEIGDIFAVSCTISESILKSFSREFRENIRVDHSTARAMEAENLKAFLAAYCIAGHHAGLPDGMYVGRSASSEAALVSRLKKEIPDYRKYKREIYVSRPDKPALKTDHRRFCISFFIRMVYSCLVDADYLDTEAFMKNQERVLPDVSMMELKKRLDDYI